ncbi:hypothetical protein ANCDUO_16340 [Ancylostoma duodenale]|uniref:Uncharacterized protein n=1 Tax=Ancylostoma duodenale TaxID=51022 RepID=A0A0C2CUM8_9BILA|nr:hypothetical protein ANCDUO_16340 [Ancylostoma duodenale]
MIDLQHGILPEATKCELSLAMSEEVAVLDNSHGSGLICNHLVPINTSHGPIDSKHTCIVFTVLLTKVLSTWIPGANHHISATKWISMRLPPEELAKWAWPRLACYNDPPRTAHSTTSSSASSPRLVWLRWKMLPYPTVLRILTADIVLLTVAAVPYCPCVLFNTTGKFYSPNYPANLEDIDCLFYHFRAPPGWLVQITFSTFSLPVRNPRT